MVKKVNSDEAIQKEISSLISAENDAWNRADACGFATRVLPDVIFTNIVGMFSVGKPSFVAQHEHIFSTIYRGSSLNQTIQHIALVKPDVAIVDTLAVLTGFQHMPPGIGSINGAIHTRLEQVLVRLKSGWWVASFHNVAVNPGAVSNAPSSPH